MFSKNHRLAKTKDVKATFARGRGFFYPAFTIKFRRGGALPRFTVVVSTKVSKKAVDRNRIKRVLRERVRLQMPGFQNGDYAIIVKPQAQKLTASQLREKLQEALLSAKLLKP